MEFIHKVIFNYLIIKIFVNEILFSINCISKLGLCAKDGRIKVGDQLIEANGKFIELDFLKFIFDNINFNLNRCSIIRKVSS